MDSSRGAYTADRAAALSGVPKSTVHYWARQEILVPSVSDERIKLWSYPDLMGLRIIYWLRQSKTSAAGASVPATTMPHVREALAQLSELDLDLWTESDGPAVSVDSAGEVIVNADPTAEGPNRQRVIEEGLLEVLEPFVTETAHGPHLHRPSPKLRIVPGKLGGSPHLVGTRLESRALSALAAGGLDTPTIYELYPDFDQGAISEAIDLEAQLAENLHATAR